MKKQNKKTGFSLLELALATLIISLLLAGVFAGNKLVYQANLKGAQALTKSSPITSIPDLATWLETTMPESIDSDADGSEISDGELIYHWNDISGNGVVLFQDNETFQPKYVAKGINGVPYVTINDEGNAIFPTNENAPISPGNAKYTIIFVFKPPTLGGYQLHQGSIGQDGRAVAPSHSPSGNGNFETIILFGGVINSTVVASETPINGHYIDNLIVDHTKSPNVYYYRNGSFTGSATVAGSFNIASDYFSVGGSAGGRVYEIIIYNRDLSPSELKVINNYLSQKYNITLS